MTNEEKIMLEESGSNTSFPLVGVVDTSEYAVFAPTVGVARYSTAPVVGVVPLRWSECFLHFWGGLHRVLRRRNND